MTRKIVGLAAIALFVFVFMVASAKAGSVLPKAPNLDFSSQTTGKGGADQAGGYVGFNPHTGNILSVTGAPILQLLEPSGHHTSSCPAGRCGVVDGNLSIYTGGCMTGCKGPNHGSESASFSGINSSLTITGEIPGLGITSDTTLLKGTFVNLTNPNGPAAFATMNSSGSKKNPTEGGINGYLLITFIDPAIIQLLGLNGNIGDGYVSEMYFNLDFLTGNNSWSGRLTGSDVIVVPTPEATSLVLLGTALLAAGWFARRRLQA